MLDEFLLSEKQIQHRQICLDKPDGLIFVFMEGVGKNACSEQRGCGNVVLPGKNKNYFSILINY